MDRPRASRDEALALDAADPLAECADKFCRPAAIDGRRSIYLAGHSLGLAPTSAARWVDEELAAWQSLGVDGHHRGSRPWITYHERAAAGLSLLAGAQPDEVVAMNSLTVNLHLMLASFFRPSTQRNRILIEQSAFPSDRYAVLSQLGWHGLNEREHLIELAPRAGARCLGTSSWIEAIERQGERLAVAILPAVQYLTGEALDIAAVTHAVQRAGAVAGVDCAHAIGNVPLRLHDWSVDFAVWCSYKYLNAGPGAIGGCFVHERHRLFDGPRLGGWWGHAKATRFEMGPQFRPIAGAEGWQISNPPIFSTAPLLASLELFTATGMPALRAKSIALTAYFEQLLETELGAAIDLITPRNPERRGAQLSMTIRRSAAEAKRIYDELQRAGVVGDWRDPDVLRLAAVPFYNSYCDVFDAVQALRHVIISS